MKLAKKRGFVTYAELNAVLPSEEVTSDQIEDVYAVLNEMGINVVEAEEADEAEKEAPAAEEEEAEGGELAEAPAAKAVATRTSEPTDRTDDPVRMYLREMGSVELLSREGEIAIAKRIEAGREAMIAGLCESPLTFQAIIIWRDELSRTRCCCARSSISRPPMPAPTARTRPRTVAEDEAQAEAEAPATAPRNPPAGLDEPPVPEDAFEEEDDMENSVSLSAMETELKPKVLETFDRVADAYKKLRRLQDQNVENKLRTRR